MRIAIRLTIPWSENLIPFFDQLEPCAVYQHDADEEVSRTHIHALVEVNVSTDTLKNRLQKILGYRLPKTDWAFSQKLKGNPIEDKFITYMSKGKLEPVHIKGFTQEQCDKYKSEWIERTKPALDNKDGSKQISSYQLSVELAEWIDSHTQSAWGWHNGVFMSDTDVLTTDEIIEKCIRIHHKYKKSYCDFSLVRVIQTCYGLTNKGSYKKQLIDIVKNKLVLRT